MAGQTRDTINARFQNDIAAAEAWKETDPEKYNELRIAATERKATALEDLSREQELDGARARATTEYPLADPSAIVGGTAEEVVASAKRSHDFVKKHRDESAAEVRTQSRAEVARQYGPGGRPATPAGQIIQRGGEERTVDQINADIETAKRRGDDRAVLALLRERGSMAALDGTVQQAVTAAAGREE